MIIIILIILLLLISVYLFVKYPVPKVFYSTQDYPEMKILEDNHKLIAKEIPKFNINKASMYPKRDRKSWNNKQGQELAESMKSEWVQGWQGDKIWFNFPLMYHNKVIDKADQKCPETIKLLKQIPSIRIAGYSILLPRSELPKHVDQTGKSTFSMACNMLLTDNIANLYVQNNKHKHRQGKMVIFDSNLEHYADNQDNKVRVILYIDFRTDTVFGERVKGFGLATELGYPTINVKLKRAINCGFYTATSQYGKVIVIVSKDRKYAECHFKEYDKKIDNLETFYFWDLTRVPESGIVKVYNQGCTYPDN